MVYYRNLYLAVGPEKFMYEAILGDLGGNCIFMVVVAISVVCAVIELIYGVRKIRGSVSNITGMMLQWPVMWAIFKGLILIVWIVTSLLGFNLWY